MTWHATGKCTEPGKMQHPVDGKAWKDFDTKYPDFAAEPRNVRLGLAADGFNPFGNLSQSYSMWPVILTTYNLPPWLCMKESSFMLTLLIPGPKSPGKDIDVYLRPLIDDLKDLWAKPGVETIDVATGLKACPTCNEDTPYVRVLGKTAYVGHRRFLKKPHKWRRSLEFNGETKNGDPPREFNRDAIMTQLARLPTRVKGKHPRLQQYLPPDVAKPLIELCLFFKQICSQTLMVDDMLKAQSKGYVAEEALTFSSHYFRDVTTKFNRPDRNVDCPPPTCQFQVFKSLGKSIGLRSVIRIDHQELKKVICEFPDNDMKEAFPGWFGKQIRQRHVDNDPGVSESSELFALAYGQRIVARVRGTVGGDDRPPSHQIPTGYGGCLGNRGKGTPKPNWVAVKKRAAKAAYPPGEPGTSDQFDMRPHMESDRWPLIYVAIQQHLQKIYNGKKAALKERHWIPDSDGTYDLERIRQSRPRNISEDEMLRLQGLGSNTETGVPYTEDEIMAIVRGGKQRGTFPVLVGFATTGHVILPRLHARTPLTSLSSKKREGANASGGGSGSGGPGDDEQGHDEDDGETGRRDYSYECWGFFEVSVFIELKLMWRCVI
ncbi:retrotransposon gag domain, retroviral aspartyl protease [Tanacetum coccineum]